MTFRVDTSVNVRNFYVHFSSRVKVHVTSDHDRFYYARMTDRLEPRFRSFAYENFPFHREKNLGRKKMWLWNVESPFKKRQMQGWTWCHARCCYWKVSIFVNILLLRGFTYINDDYGHLLADRVFAEQYLHDCTVSIHFAFLHVYDKNVCGNEIKVLRNSLCLHSWKSSTVPSLFQFDSSRNARTFRAST